MSPLVQFRNHGFDWCHIPKGNTLPGDRDFNPPWSYASVPKHILTFYRMRTWPPDSWSELYYLASRLEWLIWPTKCQTAFNMTQRRIMNWSLNDSDGHSFAPKTWSVLRLHYRTLARSQFIFWQWFFSMIANIANRDPLYPKARRWSEITWLLPH
jgi:hypothetical protein